MSLDCVRCGRPVIAESANYEVFERMHWTCFHFEFEHEGDPDTACRDTNCPALSRDRTYVDRRRDTIDALDALVAEWADGNPPDWEQWTVPGYLEAMSAWLESADNHYRNTGRPYPVDGWAWFIESLRAAARYE